jgi:hypothetical protein
MGDGKFSGMSFNIFKYRFNEAGSLGKFSKPVVYQVQGVFCTLS